VFVGDDFPELGASRERFLEGRSETCHRVTKLNWILMQPIRIETQHVVCNMWFDRS
jgi:hypothetical protein